MDAQERRTSSYSRTVMGLRLRYLQGASSTSEKWQRMMDYVTLWTRELSTHRGFTLQHLIHVSHRDDVDHSPKANQCSTQSESVLTGHRNLRRVQVYIPNHRDFGRENGIMKDWMCVFTGFVTHACFVISTRPSERISRLYVPSYTYIRRLTHSI